MQYLVHIQPQDLEQRPRALEFTLDRNPLVDLWLECVETQFTVPWHVNHLQWCTSFTTEASLQRSLEDIEQSRTALDLDRNLDINALHLLFHSYYEDQGNAADHEWDLLNRRIHKLEEQQRTIGLPGYQRCGFNCVIADEETNLVEQRPIPPELRHFWSHIPRSGDLLLGYYTLGKTIYNCVKDNDQDCVRQGMVRPQQQVSTENLCHFGSYAITANAGNRHTEVLKWVRYNKLEEFIDLALPENQFHGQPRLGQYTGTMSLEKINDLLTDGKVVFAELLD